MRLMIKVVGNVDLAAKVAMLAEELTQNGSETGNVAQEHNGPNSTQEKRTAMKCAATPDKMNKVNLSRS